MTLNRLLLLGLVFSIGILNAQTDFRPGYIINNSGDTIFGNIDYRGDLLMSTICKFADSDNIVHYYNPNDILAYRFIDGKYYVSRELNNEKYFLEFLINGIVSIYYMRDEIGDHYYIDKEDIFLKEIPYEEGTRYVDNKPYYYSSKRHYGFLYLLMQDAPDFQKRIQTIVKPQHQNLIKLAEDYHNAVCDGEKCIIYEKKQPLIKLNPEIVGGIIAYNQEQLGDFVKSYEKSKGSFIGGIIGHIWLPRVNEKIYFRTGLLYSTLQINSIAQPTYKTDSKTESTFKIPVQLEYIYPKSMVRPKIALGINLYKPFIQTLSTMCGINIKLHKTTYLSINADIDFIPDFEGIPILPKELFTYGLTTGIYTKF